MHSCIYEGRVVHCRRAPVGHRFEYRLFMVYLDLREMQDEGALRRWIPARRYGVASFLPHDHLGQFTGTLEHAVRELVAAQAGFRPDGPIRLLTQLRHLGYYFSPLNLYYCFAPSGNDIEAVVAEVNNTPWRERHHYVLWDGNRTGRAGTLQFAHSKAMHVSPFMDMDLTYHWTLSTPTRRLAVHLQNRREETRLFDAALSMKQRPLDRHQLRVMCLRYPVMTARIIAAIHWQALKLWWKKCPVYSHPSKRTDSTQRTA